MSDRRRIAEDLQRNLEQPTLEPPSPWAVAVVLLVIFAGLVATAVCLAATIAGPS